MPNRAKDIFKSQFHFGMGGVSLGNEFNKHTDREAEDTLQSAWDVGVRYFDVAPWYGYGLAERRFGHFLHNQPAKSFRCLRKSESSSRRPRTTGTRRCTRCPTRPTTSCSITRPMGYDVRSRTACNGS